MLAELGSPEDYIGRMRSKGLNDFPPEYKGEMELVFGSERLDPALYTEARFKEAKHYLQSPQRQLLQQTIGGLIWYFGGRFAAGLMQRVIKKIDGVDGRYILTVGIPGKSEKTEEVKIRTYNDGADQIDTGPFEGPSYSNGNYSNGKVIDNALPKAIRKLGWDEITQARAVALAKMSLVGIRGYTEQELWDLSAMFEVIDNKELGNTDLVKWIVRTHHTALANQYLTPALLSPRACLRKSTHISRMMGDVMFAFWACPRLDLEIFAKAIANREKSAIKSGLTK